MILSAKGLRYSTLIIISISYCKNVHRDNIMRLNATVFKLLEVFYMNKKHIDHPGVNNDVQTKHISISLGACKSVFRFSTHTQQQYKNNNENINTLITPRIMFNIFCCYDFMPNKLTIRPPLIFGAYKVIINHDIQTVNCFIPIFIYHALFMWHMDAYLLNFAHWKMFK